MKRYSRVYASVNLDAAIENMEAMHRLLKKDTSMFAVIKTDGYGLSGETGNAYPGTEFPQRKER